MIIDILSGFPEVFPGLINNSILRNALAIDAVEIWVHNLRHFTADPHGNIDDKPYGGGAGMVLMVQPVWSALDMLLKIRRMKPLLIYLSPQGKHLSQSWIRELAAESWIVILCGHYKDVDARIFERDSWTEISLGDYILTGGEVAAAALTDAVVRLLPRVLHDPESAESDSFENGLLDCSYYTRPEEIQGFRVPDMLLSGHHEKIRSWRFLQQQQRTSQRRPDLWERWLDQQKNLQSNDST